MGALATIALTVALSAPAGHGEKSLAALPNFKHAAPQRVESVSVPPAPSLPGSRVKHGVGKVQLAPATYVTVARAHSLFSSLPSALTAAPAKNGNALRSRPTGPAPWNPLQCRNCTVSWPAFAFSVRKPWDPGSRRFLQSFAVTFFANPRLTFPATQKTALVTPFLACIQFELHRLCGNSSPTVNPGQPPDLRLANAITIAAINSVEQGAPSHNLLAPALPAASSPSMAHGAGTGSLGRV